MIETSKIAGLVCPGCHGDLASTQADLLCCPRCLGRYPLVDGIPSFVPGGPRASTASDSVDLTVLLVSPSEDSMAGLVARLQTQMADLNIRHELLPIDRSRAPSFVEEVRGRHILTLDREGISNPAVVPLLWQARDRADVVIASPHIGSRGEASRPIRSALERALNAAYRRALSLPVRDVISGSRIYRREALLGATPRLTDSASLAELLIRAVAAGFTVTEIPAAPNGSGRGQRRVARRDHGILPLSTFYALWKLRNSIASADYDARAYDSIVPLQRYWQRRRYRVIAEAARGYSSVLDVGCGSSRILSAHQGMIGLDIQLHKLRYARRYGRPLVHGSIFALPFEEGCFDCVICSEVIEHIPAEEQVFDELIRVLKPGGRLILGTPDYDRWRWRALEWLYARVAPGGYADEHITHYSRANLQRYLESRGLLVESVDYVCGAEMIFRLRKAESIPAQDNKLAVSAGLRVEHSVGDGRLNRRSRVN